MDKEFWRLCNKKNLKGIEDLLNGGFNINKNLIGGGHTPLTYSCVYGSVSIVKLLLDSGADINYKTENSISNPIEITCRFYNETKYKILILLLERGVEYDREKLLDLCSEKYKKEIEGILDGVCLKPALQYRS